MTVLIERSPGVRSEPSGPSPRPADPASPRPATAFPWEDARPVEPPGTPVRAPARHRRGRDSAGRAPGRRARLHRGGAVPPRTGLRSRRARPARPPWLRTLRAVAWVVIVTGVVASVAAMAVPLWFQLQDQRLLVVTSDSMAPRIRAGDAVVVQRITDPSQLRVGQVATFWPPGGDRMVTHTIVDLRMMPVMETDPLTGTLVPTVDGQGRPVERPFIITKGDANEANDPDATPLSRVRGVVVEVHRGYGTVIGWATSAQGRWVLLAPPLVLLALLEVSDAMAARRRARPRPRADREDRVDALLLD